MIKREIYQKVENALARQAAVALIGPRQVGKTTLALAIAKKRKAVYLDLESREDREKLRNPTLFLTKNEKHLVILDEIHRVPELFQTLRGLIDQGRRKGLRTGRFLILGSASIDLLRQSGESLAGRIAYIDMEPLNVLETSSKKKSDPSKLWVRGGLPDSFLAVDDEESLAWRHDFIRTYLERDVPQFGPRIPAETLERLWIMLAHSQGQLLNASKLAGSLSVSAPTVTSYIDLLVDLFFFNDTATTEIYTLSLHDALPISHLVHHVLNGPGQLRDIRRTDHAATAFERVIVTSQFFQALLVIRFFAPAR